MRVLHITPGPVPPLKDPRRDRYYYLPEPLCGDILFPTWARSADEILKTLGPDSYPEYRVRNFTYHLFLAGRYRQGSVRHKIAILRFYLTEGLRLARTKKYDCVLTYGWTLTGFVGLVLSRLIGSKLIVQVPGAPENAYRFNRFGAPFDAPAEDFQTRVMRRVSDLLLHVVLPRTDLVLLSYPDQLKAYPKLGKVPVFVAPSFVAISQVPVTGVSDGSVLLVGAPWYVKGVDLLIEAFRTIEADFPDAKLRILGHYSGKDLEDLIGDSRQIEILKARPNPETLQIMANCSVFALASRTEGTPRVIFEAMAAGKPVVASRVAGIPYYVQDGVNGLLFEREDVTGLARQLRRALSSEKLRRELGSRGMEMVRTQYDEAAYGRRFLEMIALAVNGDPGKSAAAAPPD